MGNDFTTAQALFAGTTGPVSMTWTLFATLFTAVNTPLQADVNGIIGALTGWLLPIMRAATVVVLICAIVAACIDNLNAYIPVNTVFRVVLRAAVLIYLVGTAGAFTQWVSGPLLNLPNELSNIVMGNAGGALPQGGAAFDTIWNHTYIACVKAYQAVAGWTPEGLALGIVVLLLAGVAIIAIGYMFALYLIAYILLSLIVSVGPIFVATLLFKPTRHFFSGWLSAAVGAITTLLLISVLLSILIQTIEQTVNLVMNTASNANTLGMVGSILGCAALLAVGAIMTRKIETISVGIAGGVYHESAAYMAMAGSAIVNAGGGVANFFGGGAAAASTSAAPTAGAFAGPNIGRGP